MNRQSNKKKLTTINHSKNWLSSTRAKIPLTCAEKEDGDSVGIRCSGPDSYLLTPENVRPICNTPTCPATTLDKAVLGNISQGP